MSFVELGLEPILIDSLAQLAIVQPTPIQQQAIPLILQREDLLAGAQTGTGKTAAFGLPMIQKLAQDKRLSSEESQQDPKQVNALILTPTRELAQQVFDNLQQYNQALGLTINVVYGGTSINVQQKQLAQGTDILVATPGRLLDHLFVGNIHLKQTQMLVLDEADRMMDMGFMPDLQRILRRINPERQTLFFSATFNDKVRKVAYKILRQPKEVQIAAQNSVAERVEQMVYPVDKKRKAELLAYLIGSRNWSQVLVFTRTKQGSDELVKALKLDGIKAVSINGDKSQGARQKALDDFKAGQVRALIATDVAARGLDIQLLPVVVNFDMPFKAEDYVHRIGRTARAGEQGIAISLLVTNEQYLLDAIEQLLDQRLPQQWLAGFEPSFNQPEEEIGGRRSRSRSAEKRKLKSKLKIHANRGKNKPRR